MGVSVIMGMNFWLAYDLVRAMGATPLAAWYGIGAGTVNGALIGWLLTYVVLFARYYKPEGTP